MPTSGDLTREDGFPELYDELRRRALSVLAGERSDHTLGPTALVHEIYLRLGPEGTGTFHGRAHFMAVAAAAMRHVLVDHARARGRQKRGADWSRVDFDESLVVAEEDLDRVLVLHDLLSKLARIDDKAALIVQMRFFASMTENEIAEEMERSPLWVQKQWMFARAWLREQVLDRTE